MSNKDIPPSASSLIVHAIWPMRWFLAGQFLIAVFWSIDLSLRPYLIKVILNTVSGYSQLADTQLPWVAAILYICMSVLYVCAGWLYEWFCMYVKPNVRQRIGIAMMDRMMEHSHHLYQKNYSGNLANRISDAIVSVPKVLEIFIEQFFSRALSILIAIYTMSQVGGRYAVALMVLIILFLSNAVLSAQRGKDLADESAEARSNVFGHIVDIFGNMMNVRLFGGKRCEVEHLTREFRNSVHADQRKDWFFMRMYTVQGLLFVSYQALCLWWLITGLQFHLITPGDFALILMLNISMIECLWYLAKDLCELATHIGAIVQGLRIVRLPVDIIDAPNAKPLVVSRGEIVFENVQFFYAGSGALFENKSLVIPAGQKVGLAGYSGSGKSTLVNLILRLFDVTAGRILIDGQDIRLVTQGSLRKGVSVIPQDPLLFHRSLMENIHYGRLNATPEEVIQAAKEAHAHEFISQLSQGYNSFAGERGAQLSGGQRQRVAIARAILKNAPILILDEATSQLDPVTENLIQDSLWRLMEGKTSIVIAHRLSTLLHMERILVFDQGKIVQDGTHEELLAASGGLYKALWDAQIGGFLPEKVSAPAVGSSTEFQDRL